MYAYLLEVGVLLTECDPEFEAYNTVYDKKFGYYDEMQCYVATYEEATKKASEYVQNGVENTYAVISSTYLDRELVSGEERCVDCEHYATEDIVYSLVKLKGMVVENFITV